MSQGEVDVLAKDDNDLLAIADHSSTPVPDIYQGEVDAPFISLNPCLVLGLLSSVAVGVVGIALLWLSTPALVAIVGTGMVSVATVASCCFFYNARQGDDCGNQRESGYECCGIG